MLLYIYIYAKYKTMVHCKRDVDILWVNCYKFNGKPIDNNEKQIFFNFVFNWKKYLFSIKIDIQ